MSKVITKKALAESMKTLMRERPFSKISVDDICKSANVSRRNFYRHFPDKYALLNWIYYDDYFSKLIYHDDCVVWDYFPQICEHFYNDRAFFRNAIQVEGQNSLRTYCQELLYPLFMRDYKDTFISDKSAEFYIRRITDALFEYMKEWLKSEPCIPPDKFAAHVRKSVAKHARRTWEIASREQYQFIS